MNHVAATDPRYDASMGTPVATAAASPTGAVLPAESAVSWAAIVAGAAGAAALSLCLLVLGVGLGMSAVSPWADSGISAGRLGTSSILWITLTAVLASALGGYLAGRLRTRWTALHTDETYFRDTAHGFLAWALATLVTAGFMASAIGSVVSGGMQAGAALTGAAAGGLAAAGAGDSSTGEAADAIGYYVDSMFRSTEDRASAESEPGDLTPDRPRPTDAAGTRAREAREILVYGNGTTALSSEDTRHLGRLVAQRTGLDQRQAESRVTAIHARIQENRQAAEATAREVADDARKATTFGSLWLFVSLLAGAFFASLAATIGGRQRDA